ncbi:hypothetical protein Ana3638_00040 [Anaerocolumna sedimenticola]|uniref:Cytochrome C biogenesis protein transmembrane domain-containing protein n=1 Tax=Anaerocolumna sedimenticola TaxID=2696063 RepID=A0A6P1TID7_9FIRM|nr:sulfite exporter TauE/SafE family protein [Anaerocolumna sedimenticola]QHQ59385.1 hypothetical protein Ana3638_00040 [Anaerocolumna sedimenticola]
MGKSKKIVWGIAIIGVAVCFISVLLFGFNLINKPVYKNWVNKNGTDEVKVELFYNGPCESCKENEKFNKSVRENILKSNRNAKINCIAYNIFKEPDKEYMEKRIKALGISDSDAMVPFALMDGKLYKGSYEEIGSQIGMDISKDIGKDLSKGISKDTSKDISKNISKDISKDVDVRSMIENADRNDSILLLFTTYSCDSCAEVKKYIQDSLKSEYIIKKDQGNMLSKVKLTECNILDSGNLDLLNERMKQYAVPDDEQQVPIVFYQNGFLSGEAAIKDGLVKVIENGSAMGFSWKVGETSSQDDRMEGKDLLKLGATGFLNGLNPCSASMLLMVLSLLLMSGNDFIKGSLSYMAGKILAYLGMGMGAFFVFAVIKEVYFTRMEQILTVCFAVLALVLSILNFIDFWNARKKNYGRIIVQLPKKLRHFNHTVIKKLENIPRTFFLPMLFVLGVVISAGEFFCTGQLYAASILYMVKQNQVMTIEVFWMLLIYVLAMCLPQGIIIFIINKSRNLLAVSRFTLKGMTAVKLIYGFLFLLLFILLLFF